MERFVADALELARLGQQVPFVVCDARSGEPIGSTRFLEIRLEHLRVEIGWTWLTPRVWRTGANVEAKLMLLRHAFERVGLRRVEFKTDARNERSRGALLALGAQFEGIFRKHMVMPGGASRDSAYYAVIDDDWAALRPRLERRLAVATG
jgi:RimJ/RimL family protein N-acetyltransferase